LKPDLEAGIIDVIESKFDCCDISQVVEFMFESGIINPKQAQFYLIKNEYYDRLKKRGGESCFQIKADIAAEFDVSFPTVNNIIYTYKHIQP